MPRNLRHSVYSSLWFGKFFNRHISPAAALTLIRFHYVVLSSTQTHTTAFPTFREIDVDLDFSRTFLRLASSLSSPGWVIAIRTRLWKVRQQFSSRRSNNCVIEAKWVGKPFRFACRNFCTKQSVGKIHRHAPRYHVKMSRSLSSRSTFPTNDHIESHFGRMKRGTGKRTMRRHHSKQMHSLLTSRLHYPFDSLTSHLGESFLLPYDKPNRL